MNRRRYLARNIVLMGGGLSPLQKLLTDFSIPPRSVGYTVEASSLPAMVYDIGNSLAIAIKFDQAPVNGNNVPKIQFITTRRLLIGVEEDHASVTMTGANWTGVGAGNGYGGDYNRTAVAGEYATWTTPVGVTLVHGFGLAGADNTGLVLVTIDGDNTLANLLPTAQELVDALVVADTCLVANGGTLNPTDRIWDQYATRANMYSGTTLADNLVAGAHTVRLTCTAYKNVGSTANRLYCSGFGYWHNSVTLATAAAFVGHTYETISTAGSVWEFAHNYRPTAGGTVDEWMGHSNSDKLTSWTVTVDGAAAAPAAYAVAGGQEVKIIIVSTLHHTESVPAVADVTLTHLMTPTTFTINPVITWLVAGTVSTGYCHMFPMDQILDTGSNVADTLDYLLTNSDGLLYANKKSRAVYVWDANGYYGAMLYIPNLATLNNYVDCTTSFLTIEDRLGGIFNKMYATRAQAKAVGVSDSWDSTAEYYIKRFSGGANAALAR